MSSLRARLQLAWRLGRRELRSGLRGFGVFSACLLLGVFAISAVGSFSTAARRGLLGDARALLGGDLEVRLTHRPASEPQLALLRQRGRVSTVVELRAMAHPVREDGAAPATPLLVELKAVDANYPLYGQLRVQTPQAPAQALAQVLAQRDGRYGAAVDPLLLQRLGLAVGDRLRVGEATLEVRGSIADEPDRAVRLFSLGPRLLLSRAALRATGLGGAGSLVAYRHRVALAADRSPEQLAAELHQRFPDAGWRVRTFRQAAPRVQALLARMTTQLTLIALCTLLVGGLGIAGGVRGYLASKRTNIAVMKCVGASRRLVFLTFLGQILSLGAAASLLASLAAAWVPALLQRLWPGELPVPLQPGVYPQPLLAGCAFGLLVSLLFSFRALRTATAVSPAALFRGEGAAAVDAASGPVRFDYLVWAAGVVLLGITASLVARDVRLTLWFLASALAAFAAFHGYGALLVALAKRIPPLPLRRLRLALASVRRPHGLARPAVLSLGLGLTALTSIALIESNLSHLVAHSLPEEAPSFFFLEVFDHQLGEFEQLLGSVPGVRRWDRYPTLRGRITHIAGEPVEQRPIAPEVAWAVRGDRFLTTAARPPSGDALAAGTWWPADYRGPPLLSLTSDLAQGFGVEVGDSLTVNVLGREVTAEIASLRDVDWSTLQLNFALVLSPGALAGAPVSYLAAAHTDPSAEAPLLRSLGERLPNVTAVHVRQVLDKVAAVIAGAGAVFRGMAAIALVTGVLVLAGALSAEQHLRQADAVVYKVCGATRHDILVVLAAEFLILGGTTALLSAAAGTLAARAVVEHLLHLDFHFDGAAVLLTAAVGVLITTGCGLFGTARLLRGSPAPFLREP